MKMFSLILCLLFSCNVFAQKQTVQSTPIAVGADGLAGESGEDEATMKARAELRASKLEESPTDQEQLKEVEPGPELGDTSPLPPDGELLLETKKTPVVKAAPRERTFTMGQRFLLLKSGVMSSQWKKVSPTLKNGSSVFGFGVYQKIDDQWGASLSLDFTHGFGGSLVPEETRMFALHLKTDLTHPMNQKLHALASLGLHIADYQIRKKIGATGTTETYQNFGSGTAFGLQAALGIRAIFSKDVFVDFSGGYLQYLSSPENYFGGPLATLTLQLRL